MNRDIIQINDFTILVEEVVITNGAIKDSCCFDESLIAVAFYGEGNVDLSVNYGDKQKEFKYTKGLALSFHADEKVEFIHSVSPSKPLKSLLIATSPNVIDRLPNHEGELFSEMLDQLVNPSDHYVEGPSFIMTPEMQAIVDSLFSIQYEGKTKMMFFRSQITVLLSHFFGQLANLKTEKKNQF